MFFALDRAPNYREHNDWFNYDHYSSPLQYIITSCLRLRHSCETTG